MPGPLDPSESGSIPAPGEIPIARVVTVPDRVPPPPDAEPMLLEHQDRLIAVADILLLVALLFLFELGVSFVIRLVLPSLPLLPGEEIDPALSKALVVPILVSRTVGAVLIVALILNIRRQSPRSVGLGWKRFWINFLLGLASVCIAYGLIVPTVFFLSWVAPGMYSQLEENTVRLMEIFPRLHPLAAVPVMLCVGLWEELVFRGFLMTRLRRLTESWLIAVVLSSIAFTMLHALDQTAAALVPVAILSLIFSVLTIWRRSIVPAIIGHAVFNLTQVVGIYHLAGDQWV
ncbi:MAG: CPBP family intramembrane metalloprotease [Phycisphaerales bacterium]|nr:MAG: CPBP family intramembrane metalloprotease [Phycisphaerales bacterium]